MLIAVIAATGLNILTGFTGQISLGNAAFLAVGAYSTAFLAGRLGLPFPVVIPVAGIVTALAGMVFGVPSLRLKGSTSRWPRSPPTSSSSSPPSTGSPSPAA